MEPIAPFSRRNFLHASASLIAAAHTPPFAREDPSPSFAAHQKARRRELWSLLGDLPWQHRPTPPRLVSREEHDAFTLERLVLDLNGLEPVPAILLIPHKRTPRAPGLLYIHWHGGMYDLGKEMLLKGVDVAPPYAPVCAEKGIVTLAIDSWCFGERKHERVGRTGEENAFKEMLWKGRVLYGDRKSVV